MCRKVTFWSFWRSILSQQQQLTWPDCSQLVFSIAAVTQFTRCPSTVWRTFLSQGVCWWPTTRHRWRYFCLHWALHVYNLLLHLISVVSRWLQLLKPVYFLDCLLWLFPCSKLPKVWCMFWLACVEMQLITCILLLPDEITVAFRRFGPLVVDWPHKAESKSYFPPKGMLVMSLIVGSMNFVNQLKILIV